MAEYIEREAAKSEFNLHFGGVSHAVIASKILDEIPAADVVEVVRCKDCKFWDADSDLPGCLNEFNGLVCSRENDFCSYGEKRDNDATD